MLDKLANFNVNKDEHLEWKEAIGVVVQMVYLKQFSATSQFKEKWK